MKKAVVQVVLSLGGLGVALGAHAAPIFSEAPVDPGTGLPFTAAQLAASNSFGAAKVLEGNLVASSIKRQSLESLAVNSNGGGEGLSLNFANSDGSKTSTAVLKGGGKVDNTPFVVGEDGSEFVGRFNTTLGTPNPDEAKYWESKNTFQIDFNDGTTFDAFGFFGTDFGDFSGTFRLELLFDGAMRGFRDIPLGQGMNTQSTPDIDESNGTLQFIGFYDMTQRYNGVRFIITQNSGGSNDFLGFDDFFIGDYNRSTGTVPEPGSLALVGASLLGLAALRRRQRQG